ncbi:MAG TPA: hypothetical protein VGB87_05585 [Vicinamibacteria bacterium]
MSATLAQPLSQLHSIGLAVKVNELARDIDHEKLRDERASAASQVKALYYDLLQTESALAAAEEQVLSGQELERVVAEHVAREAALPTWRRRSRGPSSGGPACGRYGSRWTGPTPTAA